VFDDRVMSWQAFFCDWKRRHHSPSLPNFWNGRGRHHSKDNERQVESSISMIEITNTSTAFTPLSSIINNSVPLRKGGVIVPIKQRLLLG
jgi:hypothetical protein